MAAGRDVRLTPDSVSQSTPDTGRSRVVRQSRNGEETDPRVAAVLEVLDGAPASEVSRRYDVDPVVLRRWVRAFVRAGTSQVTNRPEDDLAQQRDRFLAGFAHELRTPLAVAKGWSAVLSDGDLTADEVASAADRVQVALDQMTERIREVELLAAASLGRLQLSSEVVTVADLLAEAPDLPSVTGDGGGEEIYVDSGLFLRVLGDIWDAAATDPVPRSRRIEAERTHPWLELRVVREGDPIDPAVLQALFEPFDLNADDTGITIGLYLARALTVAHGGTLGVEQDDHRAVWWLRLPLMTAGTSRGSTEEEP